MTHHKQPDRFERMVMKAIKKYDDGMLNAHDAINLLRREHQWVRKMVLDLKKDGKGSKHAAFIHGWNACAFRMFCLIEQRRK